MTKESADKLIVKIGVPIHSRLNHEFNVSVRASTGLTNVSFTDY